MSEDQPARSEVQVRPAEAKGPRTETTVREYDADGQLIRETTTTVVQAVPDTGKGAYGGYL